jgi:hypothetical protein
VGLSVRCRLNAISTGSGNTELVVNDIMEAGCSIRDSLIDIAFVNPQPMILLALVECALKLKGPAKLCAKLLHALPSCI